MRQKSDIAKIKEGRCRGRGKDYVAFILAREAHSIGTATQVYDPICGRAVQTLSMGERHTFWLLRYNPAVREIREQMLMFPEVVNSVCDDRGFRHPQRILTIDFLVDYDDGRTVGISVKKSRSVLDPERAMNNDERKAAMKVAVRQLIERDYCERMGYQHAIVFSDEIDRCAAINIEAAMRNYDLSSVRTVTDMYRCLVARRLVIPDGMSERFVRFAEIAEANAEAIRQLFFGTFGEVA